MFQNTENELGNPEVNLQLYQFMLVMITWTVTEPSLLNPVICSHLR